MDFILVRHCNLGPILHRSGDIAVFFVLLTSPLFHPNFCGVPVDQIAHVGVSPSRSLKLFRCEIIFKYFRSIPAYVITVPERHRRTKEQTDGQTTYNGITALCVASRGKMYERTWTSFCPRHTVPDTLLWNCLR